MPGLPGSKLTEEEIFTKHEHYYVPAEDKVPTLDPRDNIVHLIKRVHARRDKKGIVLWARCGRLIGHPRRVLEGRIVECIGCLAWTEDT